MAKPKGNVYAVGEKWRVKFPRGRDPVTGKYSPIQETYPTENAAWARLNKLRVEAAEGTLIAPSKITVAQFAERWLDAKRATVKGSTLYHYRHIAGKIAEAIGHVPLVKLDAPAILAWHAAELEQMSSTTVRGMHVILSMILNDAVRWKMLGHNPARDVRAPSLAEHEMTVWTHEQIRAFLTAADADPDNGAMWRLAVTTGLRLGELLALSWDDLFGSTLTVRHTVTVDELGRQTIGPPKTRTSRRSITLAQSTVAALRAYKDAQRRYQDRVGDWWNPDGLMFPAKAGTMQYHNMARRQLKTLCKVAGVPYLGAHGLRHSYATDMMVAGVPARVAQERLGHKDIALTLGLYSHVLPGMDAEAAEQIDRKREA